MTTAIKPYIGYRNSIVPWLGSVPAHWQVLRLKQFSRLNPSKTEVITKDGSEVVTFLPMEKVSSSGRIDTSISRSLSDVRSGFTYFSENDVILAKITPCFENGKSAVARGLKGGVGFGSTEFHVLRSSASILPDFLYRLISFSEFLSLGEENMEGAAGQKRVPADFVANFQAPLPPLDEQQAIADFLDVMDARVSRFIAAKRRMIALLEEKKQAAINQAVTRGLDPDVPLKDSGVDWLGEIPVHWDVMSLRRVTQSRCDGPFGSGLKSSHYTAVGVRVVRLQNIGFGKFKGEDAAFISPDYYATLGDHDVRAGDVLIAGLGDSAHPCGRACVAPSDIEPAMVKADCFRFRVFPQKVVPDFLAHQLSATASGAAGALSTGATRQRVNLQNMSSRLIALPPIEEQRVIVQQIEGETRRIDTVTVRAQHEIELIQEYRTRLISDVVTGKLDVRGVELPAVEEAVDAGIDEMLGEPDEAFGDELEEVEA